MRVMKKLLTAVLALVLIAALAAPALADTITMYVNKDQAKVYHGPGKKTGEMSKLPFGGSVEVIETEGNWSHINYINKKGVERSGWIATKHLQATAPCKHKWGPWEVIRKATCSKVGMRQHVCTKCGTKKLEEIETTEHTWGKWTVTKQASCTKSGERVHKCKVCGTKETKKLGKSEHSYSAWTVDQAATCAAAGSQSRVCALCGNKETEVIPQLPHTFGEWSTLVPLSREADGERGHTCAVCGTEERETVPATPAFTRKDRGEGVRAAQDMLNALGFDAGKADGIYGPKLDRAFEAFADENGVAFAEGWLKPAQLDALVSRWIESVPDEAWKGEGSDDAPIKLALTVEPAGTSDGARSFNWTLTNQGSTGCALRAVLMGAGAEHDFRSDDMAVVLDSEKLKPGAKNSLSGSFTVPESLGGSDGALSFRAVVEADKTGEKWISNAVVVELGNRQ